MISFPAALAIFSAVLLEVSSSPVKYDQRQEGDLNVRTDVEDVLFVVVPPKDLIATGMGLMAATAADLLTKNYGPIGPERWPQRTSSKIGFVPLEKSPYKIDLERSGVQLKKVSQVGDPNRYNFHENKNPSKAVPETKPSSTETPKESKPTTEKVFESLQSTTESKTVKKDLKPEVEAKTEKKEEKKILEKKSEGTKVKSGTGRPEGSTEEPPIVIGDGLDSTSIFRHEGCGPEAYRDSTGKCVYEKPEISSK